MYNDKWTLNFIIVPYKKHKNYTGVYLDMLRNNSISIYVNPPPLKKDYQFIYYEIKKLHCILVGFKAYVSRGV